MRGADRRVTWLYSSEGLAPRENQEAKARRGRKPQNPHGNQALGGNSRAPDRLHGAILGPASAFVRLPPNLHDFALFSPPEMSPMNRIRAARQALGWTQNDLAKKANVSPRTIHAVEKGRPCRQATKRHILNALGVPWEMRNEYFVRARSVRPMVPALDEARSA